MEVKLTDRQTKILSEIGRGIQELRQRQSAVLDTILAGANEEGPATVEEREDGVYLVRPEPEE